MKPNRLLAIAALAFACGSACAYEIIESRYRVEIAPGQFQDQLVLKCDNGRKLTVPWEARLYEACGEDLIGRQAKAEPPEGPVQERQKEVMLSRVREQYGNIDERYVQFQSGPAGVSMQLQGPIRDILKRYEICRKQAKNSPTCATERDQAMAALTEKSGPSPKAAGEPIERVEPRATEAASEIQPAPTAKPVAKPKKAVTKAKAVPQPVAQPEPTVEEAGTSVNQVTEVAPPQKGVKPAPLSAAPVADAPGTVAQSPVPASAGEPQMAAMPALVEASAQQKIAEDYAWCMRAKPKFECEQARAKALSALTKPKPAKPAAVKGKTVVKEAGPMKAVYTEPAPQ